MAETRIREASTGSDYETARALFREYSEATGVATCFSGFADELAQLPVMYGRPRGRLLLAWQGGEPVGCVGLRSREPDVCEMKRLYVRPEARGAGLGRRLVNALMETGREAGYRAMVLDTLMTMTEARALYRSLGFTERAPYYPDPQPGVTFMELTLAGDSDAS